MMATTLFYTVHVMQQALADTVSQPGQVAPLCRCCNVCVLLKKSLGMAASQSSRVACGVWCAA
jgi:hypothetical protein